MTDIDNLLKRLNSRRASIREAALREADTLDAAQIETMVQKAANLALWQMGKMWGAILTSAVLISFFVTYIVLDLFGMRKVTAFNIVANCFLSTLTDALWMYLFMWKLSPRAHRSLITLLANKTGKDYFEVLLKMYRTDFLSVWKYLDNIVPQKFLELEIGETEDLVLRHKHTFCWMLKKPYQAPNFTIRVLEVLTNVGDASVVPTVRRLIRRQIENPHAEDIQQAAKACLAAIESRQMNHNETQTLLRPSEKTEGGTELLRPVASRPDAEPQQLLRASQKQESGTPE